MYLRREPYIWTTWITGLLAGSNHCQWAAWIRSNYGVVKKRESGVDLAVWKGLHGAMVQDRAAQLLSDGLTVYVEDQNKFNLRGHSATLGGVPDIVAVDEVTCRALVVDCKTGKPRDSDIFQVLIYMMMLPLAKPHLRGLTFEGELYYGLANRVEVPASRLNDSTRQLIQRTITKMSEGPLPKVPSLQECKFCDIAKEDCPEKMGGEPEEVSATDLF